MTATPWDGVERRADGTNRRRIAIIFDPVQWREKIHGAPGRTGAPPDAAQSGNEVQEVAAGRDGGMSKNAV